MTKTRIAVVLLILLGVLFAFALTLDRNTFLAYAQDDTPCVNTLPTRMIIGERGMVTLGTANNVRVRPTIQGELVGYIPGGGSFITLDGPVCSDGFAWWQVNYDGLVGWTAEGQGTIYWLEPLPRITPENAAQVRQLLTLGRDGFFADSVFSWSPDRATLAMTSSAGVLLLRANDLSAPPRQIDQERDIRMAAFSRDWRLLATASIWPTNRNDPPDTAIRLFDVATGELLRELDGHTGFPPGDLVFSPDGSRLWSRKYEENLLWDTATGEQLSAPPSAFSLMAFSPDNHAYYVNAEGYLWLWDAQTGQPLGDALVLDTFIAEERRKMFINPAGTRLVAETAIDTGGNRPERHVNVWDLTSGELLHFIAEATLYNVDWSSGLMILSAPDSNVVVHDIETGAEISALQIYGDNPENHYIWGFDEMVVSPERALIALSGSEEFCSGGLGVWNLYTGEIRYLEQGGCRSITFHPHSSDLVFTDGDNAMYLWHPDTDEVEMITGGMRVFTNVVFSANGTILIASDQSYVPRNVHIWDTNTWREIDTVRGYTALSPDGALLAGRGYYRPENEYYPVPDDTIRLWDVSAGEDIAAWPLVATEDTVSDVVFSPNGNLLAVTMVRDSAGGENRLLLLDLTTKELVATFNRPNTYPSDILVFSPDGERLLAGLRILDVETAITLGSDLADDHETVLEEATVVTLQTEGLNFLPSRAVFSPNGISILAMDDRYAALWDAATGEQMHFFNPLESRERITEVSFSPDGRELSIITNEWDYYGKGRLYLLDTATGEQVYVYDTPGEEEAVTDVAFSPDGNLLSITTVDMAGYHGAGHLYLLDAATGELLAAPHGHHGAAWGVAFSPNGEWIASAGGGCYQCEGWGWDNVVRLWSVRE